jgi:putative PEP-CTERM system histidine kinase
MNLLDSPIQAATVTASAMLAAVIGVLALLRRGHWLTTLVFASAFLSMAAFQAGTLGILHASSEATARPWAAYLGFVSALASWLWLTLSVVLARPDPWPHIRDAGAYLALALIGCIGMAFASNTPLVVESVQGHAGEAVVVLGAMGKIYLMYLVVVMVAVLMNLERMLRTAPAHGQKRLRPMYVAFLVAVLGYLLVISGGLLYSGLRVRWLAACAAPVFVSGVVTSFSLARQRLSDMSVPVARPVIYYSSVSLTLAGLFLLAMAVLSRVLPVLTPEWKHAAGIAFYVLAGGGGLVLLASPGANRAVKRFIDRNFYANRYDYRREWERVSAAITPTARPEDVCRQVETLLCSVFEAERVAIHLRDDRAAAAAAAPLRRLHGPSGVALAIEPEDAMVRHLAQHREPLLFSDLAQDLDLVGLMVAHRATIEALDAAVVAPLAVGDQLVGLLWLSQKRTDEDYSQEDAEFLGAMSRQLAAALWFAHQAETLAETRQLESLNRLASLVLHDIKNQVSGLSLVVENARRHIGNPDFQRDAMGVVERTVGSLRELMAQVSALGRPADVRPEPLELRPLVEEALATAGLTLDAGGEVRVSLECRGSGEVTLDKRLVLRLLVNLLTNARESLSGPGDIRIGCGVARGPDGSPHLVLEVADTGRGMTEEFMRTTLFRPFGTTKPAGLGVGLTQCKSIVEAHGGRIEVASRVGEGTSFKVTLPGAAALEPEAEPAAEAR